MQVWFLNTPLSLSCISWQEWGSREEVVYFAVAEADIIRVQLQIPYVQNLGSELFLEDFTSIETGAMVVWSANYTWGETWKSLSRIVQSSVKPPPVWLPSEVEREDVFYRMCFHKETRCPISIAQLRLFLRQRAESYGSCRNMNFGSLNKDILEGKCHSWQECNRNYHGGGYVRQTAVKRGWAVGCRLLEPVGFRMMHIPDSRKTCCMERT